MIGSPTLLLLITLAIGCQAESVNPDLSTSDESVYALVVSDLAQRESPDASFVGTEVWVAPQFSEGDSLLFSWGDDVVVDEDLVSALKQASKQTAEFPSAKQFGPNARVTEIESFHDLHYYGENSQPIAAKCLVQFWRPGYSNNGKRAVVRFYYGPSPHGAAGTYVLQYATDGWQIVSSTISYYF